MCALNVIINQHNLLQLKTRPIYWSS